jgi:hypothetical protein
MANRYPVNEGENPIEWESILTSITSITSITAS